MMKDFWESKFRKEGAVWQFEPADSAIEASRFFKKNNLKKILIPGSGYGRNVAVFQKAGFDVTGIEISETAIKLAKGAGLDYHTFYGSVTEMPFDDKSYDGIFCYALIHLLNRNERISFLNNCFNQLRSGGYMIFTAASKAHDFFRQGKMLSRDRYRVKTGVDVFFYDELSVEKEFRNFGLLEFKHIEEPVRFIDNAGPVCQFYILCRKNKA